jgi:hypothetical protein
MGDVAGRSRGRSGNFLWLELNSCPRGLSGLLIFLVLINVFLYAPRAIYVSLNHIDESLSILLSQKSYKHTFILSFRNGITEILHQQGNVNPLVEKKVISPGS